MTEGSLSAYCTGTEELVDDLVDAVITEQPPLTAVATDKYVTVRDRSCERATQAQ